MLQSRRRRGRRLTRATSPTHVPHIKKRQSLQNNPSLSIRNRELAFRQLAEQLWAAGLPSSKTACALSIRSRCSSAPPSERGVDDEMTKISWKNGSNDEQENMIDWDEPDQPDEGNKIVTEQKKRIIHVLTFRIRMQDACVTIDYICFARLNALKHR